MKIMNNNSNKLTISEETRQKTNYTPSKNNKKHVGFVYIRVYVKNGKIYIGETKNMLDRNYHFRSLAVVYGGKRIEEARKLLGVSSDDWKWDILERVEANSDKELEEKLKQKEAEYIIKYKSYEEKIGFNSTRGLSQYLNGNAA
jgi:hypothetical protein